MLSKIFDKTKQFLDQHKYKILAGVCFGLGGYAFYKYAEDDTRIRLSAFIQALEANHLDEVVVKGDTVYFKSAVSDWYHTSIDQYPLSKLFDQLKQRYLQSRKSPDLKYSCETDEQLGKALFAILTAFTTAALTVKILMPQKFGTINKFPKIVHNHETFQNFYGSEQIKLKLKEIVQYLVNKQKFQKLGGRLRKGILLYGPPGTGKTMLAKTLANEANLPFIQTCASEFEEIYVGVGPKKIRQIFLRAKNCPNGCIVFIDELDAIGSRSDGHRFSRQTTATINQLLTELDGFEENHNVVVIGATNRADLIDPALLRAGRFDIKVKLNQPNANQRKGIFKILLKKKGVPHNISEETINLISQKAQGWTGADVQALINQSIYKAVRLQNQNIEDANILEAFEQVLKN